MQMLRIAAGQIAAAVSYPVSWRDWSQPKLIGEAVCGVLFVRDLDIALAVGTASSSP
jgi:hypothetical protein